MTEHARGWGRRALLRRGLLVVGGAVIGAGTSEAWWSTHRRTPIAGGPASATYGNGRQGVGSGALEVVWSGPATGRLVALTFDDGPAPQWTPMVLDTLARHRVPATFFMVGEQVRRHAEVVQGRLTGHEVGNHSWQHRDLAELDAVEAYDDLRRSHDAIAEVTGRSPLLFRPPYGHLGGAVLHGATRLDYRLVLWSLQMVEREFPDDPAGHAQRIVARVRPGTIVLGHDVGARRRLVALRGLPDMINGLRSRGYTFVTVSTLLGAGVAPTVTR
ncbi:polysaccharide deacetylase family protein [Micromonospora tarensis]|uniref:Polysaccharide deacetylase family protein n=1 Tax=Micromonospora tarensis TaxID=2806100 RepID=A0ABS1YHJ8_9ACTN|nr:polysaccharide deacetylase family protein [Micromonospora tarensis]MBM0276895.1 polysaccharide deacetylase family protein [Micromonospora tarensis]